MAVKFYPSDCGTASIITGGEEEDYLIENISDRNYNTLWKNDNSGETVTLQFYFSSVIAPTYLVIVNHNLYNAGYGIKFYTEEVNDGNFTTPYYLIGSSGAYHDSVGADAPIWVEEYTQYSARQYYRLEIENFPGIKPEIACVSIGTVEETDYNWSFDGTARGYRMYLDKFRTAGEKVHVNKRANAKQTFSLMFENMSTTGKANIIDVLEETDYGLYPFTMKDADDEIHYVRFEDDDIAFEDIEYQLYNNQLNLIEAT